MQHFNTLIFLNFILDLVIDTSLPVLAVKCLVFKFLLLSVLHF